MKNSFYMLTLRRPVSLNKGKNEKYKAALALSASESMKGKEILQGRLYARIIWLHSKPTTQDVDNIVKPILDSLVGVVFDDDSQVGECHVTKIDVGQPYTFLGTPEEKIFERLSKALAAREEHILLIEIGESPEQIADFGLEQEAS